MSSEKLILLAIAMGTIGLVLVLGYKLDKYEEKGKRKEKDDKKQCNKTNIIKKDIVSDFSKKIYVNDMNKVNVLDDLNKKKSNNTKYSEELDRTAVIDRVNLSELEVIEDNLKDKKIYKVVEVESKIEEKNEDFKYDTLYNYEKFKDSTTIFNSTIVKEEKNNLDYKIKDINGA